MNGKYQNFIDKVLDGRYKILELVGVGGMSFVLKAEDLLMDRTVAIKILNDEYNGDKSAEERFINESKAVAMLSHKHLVSIYDVAIYPDMKYIVMEYLDGITLKEYMDKKGPLPWKEACIYTMQILRALEHAHSKDVIHRDIKPQNIILQKNGEIKVTDFGIAKTPHEKNGSTADRAIGTVYYISPEQASSKETTFASDLYSVGIMLYEMVTGVLPFTAENLLEIAMMQINADPGNPCDINPDIPFGVAQIIRKAMEKDPTNRFSSAHNMKKALDMVVRNPAVTFSMGNDYPAGEPLPYNVVPIESLETSEIEAMDEVTGDGKSKPIDNGSQAKKRYVKKRKKKKKAERESRSLLPVIAAIAFSFLLVCASCGVYYLIFALNKVMGPSDSAQFYVPNLVGLVWNSELENKLESGEYDANGIKYRVKVGQTYQPDKANGEILEQTPGFDILQKMESGQKSFPINIKINVIPDNIEVPFLRGYTFKEAEVKLKNMGFIVEKIMIADDYGFANQVVSTEPAFGSEVMQGSTVKVFVSIGRDVSVTQPMPDVLGMTRQEAVTMLERYNYTVKVVYENDGDFSNLVLEQSIKPGTADLAPFTEVELIVSGASNQQDFELGDMPDLLGLTREEAEDFIIAIGMVPNNITQIYSDDYEPGTVVGQSVDYGLPINPGDKVDLIICIGPDDTVIGGEASDDEPSDDETED